METLFPEKLVVTEVGPRDGLQSLNHCVPTDRKIQMIELLAASGVRSLEVTSFAHPKVVPQLADAEEVVAAVRHLDIELRALVPSLRGGLRAVETDIDVIVALLTASETYTRLNQNRSVDGALKEALETIEMTRHRGKKISTVIGTAFVCPYEGKVPPEKVMELTAALVEVGVQDICFGATAGLAYPRHVFELADMTLTEWPNLDLAIHLHDTNRLGFANMLAAIAAGIRRVESSICGIGGGIRLPSDMDGYGNLPTEKVVPTLNECGIDCGISSDAIERAAGQIQSLLDESAIGDKRERL